MAEIVGIGANCFDTLFRLERFPAEDTKMKAESVAEAGGGPCATGLCAAAKLGASCAWIGNLADDRAGAFLRVDLEKRGVDTGLITTAPGERSFVTAVLLSAETGTRTCLFHRGSVPPARLGEKEKEAVRKAKILMVDGNDLDAAVEAASIAREAGRRVLYDAGGRYEGVERLLPLADLLIPSEEFALAETGKATAEEAARELFRRYSPKWVVVTQGKRGGVYFDGKTFGTYPVYPAEVVDSNGSGDVFHGAFAVGVLRGFSLEECCRFSSAVSALKCTRVGARDAVPTPEELRKYLAAHSVPVRF